VAEFDIISKEEIQNIKVQKGNRMFSAHKPFQKRIYKNLLLPILGMAGHVVSLAIVQNKMIRSIAPTRS
jgi:hypothetical protein